jgi:hypothetical protein
MAENTRILESHSESLRSSLLQNVDCALPASLQPLIAHIEILTRQITDAQTDLLDPANVTLMRKHCAPDFQLHAAAVTDPNEILCKDLETYIDIVASFNMGHPDFFTKATSVLGSLSSDCNEATVWVTAQGMRRSCGHWIQRMKKPLSTRCGEMKAPKHHYEAILIFRWRADRGRWTCYQLVSMRYGGWLPE